MPEFEKIIGVVREWVIKAENDLKNATHTLELGEEGPTDTICFHAQQCVEKYLKAMLTLQEIDFSKTHDIEWVNSLLPEHLRPDLTAEEQRRLTAYATVTRYPGEYEPIALKEAKQAVRIARRVRSQIRKHIPKRALVRRKK